MLRLLATILFCVLVLNSAPLRSEAGVSSDKFEANLQQAGASTASSVFFTKNMGQWPDSILFRADAAGATIWIAKDAIYYQFTRVIYDESTNRHSGARGKPGSYTPDSVEIMMVKASFVGANPNVQVESEGERDFKFNYFLGNDPSKWATDVPSYEAVTLKDLYPNVSLKLEAQPNGQVDYQVIAKDPDQTRALTMVVDGNLEILADTEGRRLARTPWGNDVEIIDPARSLQGSLLAYTGGGQVSRDINAVPVSLHYSTLLGGSLGELANGIAVDNIGSAYVTGWTQSINFPTQNAYDGTRNSTDSYVTKLSPSGTSLVYSTFFGGSATEVGHAIAVDSFGCAYLTGYTSSANFPTQNAFDASYNGLDDTFVAKFSALGNTLLYSTYLGGSNSDYGNGIAVDTAGSAYVGGSVNSSDFPTQNAYNPSMNGALTDVFLTKFAPSGSALSYSTYLGGSDLDYGFDVAVDDSCYAYVSGGTLSSDFPTQDAYDATTNGDWDVFVTKFSVAGNTLVYSTYIGGSDYDFGDNVNVYDFNAYITGASYSTDYPTQNAYDATHNGDQDIFVSQISLIGDALVYSTYLGGSGSEYGEGIAFDASGNIYVAGYTTSSDFPTQNAFDATYSGVNDIIVSKFSASGNTLLYSTYLGGSGDDHSYGGLAVDSSGIAYVTGETYSTDFPMHNAYDPVHNGVRDIFVTAIVDCNSGADADLDGVNDLCDNCPNTLNSNQLDADGDLVGDACDNCPVWPNPLQEDNNANLIGDACDACGQYSPYHWTIGNGNPNLWSQSHWSQFSYCGQPSPCGECCINCPSSDFPDWNLFVNLIGEDEAYFDPPPGSVKFRPSAINQWRAIKGPWGGSCFGFAASFLLYVDNRRNPDDDFPEFSGFLPNVTVTPSSRDLVHHYFFYQYGFEEQRRLVANENVSPTQILGETNEMFCHFLDGGSRVLMMFNQNGTGAHAVAPYRRIVDGSNPDLYYLYVHDSNFPGDTTKRIDVNTFADTWSYSGLPGWGGNSGLILTDTVGSYMSPLVLEDTSAVPQVMTIYFGETDSALFVAPLFGAFGFNADSLFGEIPGSHPIIPADGQETSPIGYFLPTTYYNYQIVGVESGQCIINYGDNIQWRVGGAKAGIISASVTAAAQNVNIYAGAAKNLQDMLAVCDTQFVELLIIEPDSEMVIRIEDIDMAPGDSVRFSIVSASVIKVDNYGAASNYDLSVQIVSASADDRFYHADIPITANTAHSIHFDWRQSNDSVNIDIDVDRNGSIDSTLIVSDQATPVFYCGDADGNSIVTISDAVFLINYIFSGGPAPSPILAGDADCNGIVTISDAVYLINYIFSGGPQPCSSCP